MTVQKTFNTMRSNHDIMYMCVCVYTHICERMYVCMYMYIRICISMHDGSEDLNNTVQGTDRLYHACMHACICIYMNSRIYMFAHKYA